MTISFDQPSPGDNHEDPAKAGGIAGQIERLSEKPGVYLMKDAANRVIYIGKARNLKKRVATYFKPLDQLDIKTGRLTQKIAQVETIITRSEKEALILESNLIKQHKPRYNVVLKDDKRYPSLKLDRSHPFPNLTIVRKTPQDGSLYFGPFASAYAVRQSLKFINKTFKLRKCKNREFASRSRPCLHHQMDACLGPCCLDVDSKLYESMVAEVILFLNGRTPALLRRIKKRMLNASAALDFEKAARLRDKMIVLEKTLEKQLAVTTDFKDRDAIAVARSSEHSIILVFSVRGGYLVGSRDVVFGQTLSTDSELMRTFIRQYYEKTPFIPTEILVGERLEDARVLEEWLCEKKGRKVLIRKPLRGEKLKLIQLAHQNAENRLKEHISQKQAQIDILARLQKNLKMNQVPARIECFDNSNISGSSAVAGMVVFKDGQPKKSRYRKYLIKSVHKQDDYAYMEEVLKRRFGKGKSSEPLPDLLVVDGGKGQLNIAVSIMRNLGVEDRLQVIGIAKRDESRGETQDKIFEPGRSNPLNVDHQVLLFLQRIRDEAHRFAIQYHRSRRKSAALDSELDHIPGIGKKRKAILMKTFGSIRRIRAATLEELSGLPGMNQRSAEATKNALSQ